MHPDEDQLGDYKAAMENLNNAQNCDNCGKAIQKGDGFSITTRRGGIQSFHKDANKCANASSTASASKVAIRGRGGTGKTSGRALGTPNE